MRASQGDTSARTSGLISRKHDAQSFHTVRSGTEKLAPLVDGVQEREPFIFPGYVPAAKFSGLISKWPIKQGLAGGKFFGSISPTQAFHSQIALFPVNFKRKDVLPLGQAGV